MNLITLFRKISPYVKPYRWLVVLTLILTIIGSFIAQINAVVLDRTVDAINSLITTHTLVWSKAAHILTVISVVLLGKEIFSAGITYAQHYFGEKMRINVSKDLSQAVIDHMLRYRMAFFSRPNNETGKLQTRIDRRSVRANTVTALFGITRDKNGHLCIFLKRSVLLKHHSTGHSIIAASAEMVLLHKVAQILLTLTCGKLPEELSNLLLIGH